MSGNQINQIFGEQTAYQADYRTEKTRSRVKHDFFPVHSHIRINPYRLNPKLLKPPAF